MDIVSTIIRFQRVKARQERQKNKFVDLLFSLSDIKNRLDRPKNRSDKRRGNRRWFTRWRRETNTNRETAVIIYNRKKLVCLLRRAALWRHLDDACFLFLIVVCLVAPHYCRVLWQLITGCSLSFNILWRKCPKKRY